MLVDAEIQQIQKYQRVLAVDQMFGRSQCVFDYLNKRRAKMTDILRLAIDRMISSEHDKEEVNKAFVRAVGLFDVEMGQHCRKILYKKSDSYNAKL